MSQTLSKVVVVGSLNLDYIAAVRKLPAAGETVSARGLIRRFGGKGANQAIAAARQGANVSLIGCLGAGDEGKAYRERLTHEGVNHRGVSATEAALTGTALIAVDATAENTIIVAAGANGELRPAAIRAQQKVITAARVLLLQQEVPPAAVEEAIRTANRAGVRVVLNPSPLDRNFCWGKSKIDTLIVNEVEARAIFGLRVEGICRRLAAWRRSLVARRIQRLIITRGARATYCLEQSAFQEIAALAITPVDTVGAGDAFAGVLAARLAEGADIVTAIQYANCAGALTTLLPGAQEAIPNRAATEAAFLKLASAKAKLKLNGATVRFKVEVAALAG